jgi:hypothetical protein
MVSRLYVGNSALLGHLFSTEGSGTQGVLALFVTIRECRLV